MNRGTELMHPVHPHVASYKSQRAIQARGSIACPDCPVSNTILAITPTEAPLVVLSPGTRASIPGPLQWNGPVLAAAVKSASLLPSEVADVGRTASFASSLLAIASPLPLPGSRQPGQFSNLLATYIPSFQHLSVGRPSLSTGEQNPPARSIERALDS